MGCTDLGVGHFVGDGGAAVKDRLGRSFLPGSVGASSSGGPEEILSEGHVGPFYGTVELEIFNEVPAGFGRAGIPGDLKLGAGIVEILSHGGCKDQFILPGYFAAGKSLVRFVSTQGFYRTVLSVTEKDELDAVEAERSCADFVSCACALIEQMLYDLCIGKGQCKLVFVKGPGVDVRVDTESGGCSEQESFALLPILAGFKECLADFVQIGLGKRLGIAQCCELLPKGLGLVGQAAINTIDDIGDILFDGALERGLFL